MVHSKAIRDSLSAADLRVRNWSGAEIVVLAVYTATDCYLGTVTATAKSLRMGDALNGFDRWYKRDVEHFNRLSRAYLQALHRGVGGIILT
jgi:hypothetical protein